MIMLNMGRSQGKTVELVRRSNRDWRYIVCKDDNRLKIILDTAKYLGLDIPNPITIRECPLRSSHIKSVLMDDMEDILEFMVGKPIDLATSSCQVIGKNYQHQIDNQKELTERSGKQRCEPRPNIFKIPKY